MKKVEIKILNLKYLKKFVEEAEKVQGDVLVQRGKFTVDGRSLLGLLSINTFEGCLVLFPEDAINFEKFLNEINNKE